MTPSMRPLDTLSWAVDRAPHGHDPASTTRHIERRCDRHKNVPMSPSMRPLVMLSWVIDRGLKFLERLGQLCFGCLGRLAL